MGKYILHIPPERRNSAYQVCAFLYVSMATFFFCSFNRKCSWMFGLYKYSVQIILLGTRPSEVSDCGFRMRPISRQQRHFLFILKATGFWKYTLAMVHLRHLMQCLFIWLVPFYAAPISSPFNDLYYECLPSVDDYTFSTFAKGTQIKCFCENQPESAFTTLV